MNDNDIYKIISEELLKQNFEFTRYFLDRFTLIYENEKIKIERIDRDDGENIFVYVPIKNEPFYLRFCLNKKQQDIHDVDTEPGVKLFLWQTSELLSLKELVSIDELNPIKTWNLGDKHPRFSDLLMDNSGIKYEPNSEPDSLEDKISLLLNNIEKSRNVGLFFENEISFNIQCFIDYYYENQLLGNFILSRGIVKKMMQFNIEIEFNIAAWGKSF
ncbi:hypothetical protein [Rhizosphaericola mali]|uniref:DUF4279 domain-containing protein n=1 Tax=Rhizosphaericola mali TaxID=2545455 RepID=A0A5P2FXP1_9BACT|nr:hypothetical protein [Rhizosphaericola mali]QES87965.1 hypothetical protein E0W69_004555 [Rhizosphaericola mali]